MASHQIFVRFNWIKAVWCAYVFDVSKVLFFSFGFGECTVRLGAYVFQACLLFWRCDDTISHVPCIEVESERVGEGEFEGMREHVNETDGKLSSQPPLHTAHTHTLAKSAVSSSTASKQQVILWNWTFCVGQMYRESNLFFYICPVVCHCVCVCMSLFICS